MIFLKKTLLLGAGAAVLIGSYGCTPTPTPDYGWIKHAVTVSVQQVSQTLNEMGDTLAFPRSVWTGFDIDFLCSQLQKDTETFKDSLRTKPFPQALGTRRYCSSVYDWTSGFFPGTMWYLYQITGKEVIKQEAARFTNYLYPVKDYKKTHDVGFIMNSSYGNAYRLTGADTIPAILTQTAESLCSRYNSQIKALRSWDFGPWNFPVIIDNMMNLELLFYVSRLTQNPKYKDVAVQHALTTLQQHFRADNSSYHVVSYQADGTVESKGTHQGKHDDSSWARGQAWAVYGYTLCYRETQDPVFLAQAQRIAAYIMSKVKNADAVPYWDYDAPDTPQTPRDASAAAITAAALVELSTLSTNGASYLSYAEKLLQSLSSEAYLAQPGTNCGFILRHSVGSLPNGSEIDTPINYADYYYIEALSRYMKVKGLTYAKL